MNLPTQSAAGIPIFYWSPPPTPPKDFYLLAKNGLFRVTDLDGICQAITPASFEALGISLGQDIEPVCAFTGPKLSFDEHLLTVRFYQQICEESGDEALVVYHIHNGKPMAVAPKEQWVSGGHVSYEPFDFVCVACRIGDGARMRPNDPPPPCPSCQKKMETLNYWGGSHSHNSMAAFASSTDVANEASLPGVHLIYGRLDKALPAIDIYGAIVVNGYRFELKGDDLKTVVDLDDPNVRTLSKTTKKKKSSYVTNITGGWGNLSDDDLRQLASEHHGVGMRHLGEIPTRPSGRNVTGFEDFDFDEPGKDDLTSVGYQGSFDTSDLDGINGESLK